MSAGIPYETPCSASGARATGRRVRVPDDPCVLLLEPREVVVDLGHRASHQSVALVQRVDVLCRRREESLATQLESGVMILPPGVRSAISGRILRTCSARETPALARSTSRASRLSNAWSVTTTPSGVAVMRPICAARLGRP
jgi:hypothetical protein